MSCEYLTGDKQRETDWQRTIRRKALFIIGLLVLLLAGMSRGDTIGTAWTTRDFSLLSTPMEYVPYTNDTLGYITYPSSNYDPTNLNGIVQYAFTLADAGDYYFIAKVRCIDSGHNSVYVDVDQYPTNPAAVCDFEPTGTNWVRQPMGWRGTGPADMAVTNVWTLSAGDHTLVIAGREPDTQISVIELWKVNAFQPTPMVVLAWDPSPDDNLNADSTIAGYRVHYGTASGSYPMVKNVGHSYSTSIDALSYGVTYYFAATCVGTNQMESDFSNEISYTVPLPAPTTPVGLKVRPTIE